MVSYLDAVLEAVKLHIVSIATKVDVPRVRAHHRISENNPTSQQELAIWQPAWPTRQQNVSTKHVGRESEPRERADRRSTRMR